MNQDPHRFYLVVPNFPERLTLEFPLAPAMSVDEVRDIERQIYRKSKPALKGPEYDPHSVCWILPHQVGLFPPYTPDILELTNRLVPAAQWLWQARFDVFPPGFKAGHLCGNTHCITPSHIVAVGQRLNPGLKMKHVLAAWFEGASSASIRQQFSIKDSTLKAYVRDAEDRDYLPHVPQFIRDFTTFWYAKQQRPIRQSDELSRLKRVNRRLIRKGEEIRMHRAIPQIAQHGFDRDIVLPTWTVTDPRLVPKPERVEL